MNRYLTIFYFLFCTKILINSQGINFKHFTSEDGLPTNTINTILQDSNDYMWVGTNYGLSLFNGYNFINFKYSKNDTLSLSNNTVKCLCEDNKRDIWIGTLNGLNKFNRDLFRVERIPELEGYIINAIKQLSNGILLIGTESSGLFEYNVLTGKKLQFTNSSKVSSISSNRINCITKDHKRGIIVGTGNGLDLYNPKNSSFDNILPNTEITNLSYSTDSTLYISTTETGIYYNWTSQHPEKILLPKEYSDRVVLSIIETESDKWIAFDAKGVLFLDKTKSEQYQLTYDKYNTNSISSNAIMCILKDKWENIWIGTFDGGINFLEKQGKKFISIRDNYLPTGIRNDKVRSIYQDSDDDIWVGTKINGTLSKFNKETLEFEHYLSSKSETDNYISCITEHKPGKLWVGTFNGLYLFNKNDDTYEVHSNNPNQNNSISSNYICSLLKDSNFLYIGHQDTGLDIYNTKKQSFKNYRTNSQPLSISNNKVRVIYKDSRQNIWVGTMDGLNRFDPKTGTFLQFLHNKNDASSISDNEILCINEDSAQNLWIGTKYGLNLMDREKGTFKSYTSMDGLPDNTINAIYEGKNGYLWLCTHIGISKFHSINKTVLNYDSSDGISSNELSSFSHCTTRNGDILIGSNNGLTLFNPNQIIDNQITPKVVLTNFKIANKEIDLNNPKSPLKKHISQCKEIILTHEQSFISFEYAGINYSSTKKNKYAYMMEGLENDWNYVGTKREASYTNLSPGDYVFKVKASNNDDTWNEEGISIEIQVLPPFWLTWWAYIIYLLIITGLIILYRKYTIQRVKVQNELKQNKENLQFFLNVSHEFRTPITLLLNPLRKILHSGSLDDAKKSAQNANISAIKLMNLTNQLLNFRKVDAGQTTLNVKQVDIVEYSNKLLIPFIELAKANGIEVTQNASHPNIQAWIDPDKYEIIINNLLSNAIKFTGAGGSVSLNIELDKTRTNIKALKSTDYVKIHIQDTGKGIPSNRIKHIFERFYSENNSFNGTGIGLHYTKSLVEMHNGNIKVESALNTGSTFTIELPINNSLVKAIDKNNSTFDSTTYSYNKDILSALTYDLNSKSIDIQEDDQANEKPSQIPLVLIVEDNKQLRHQIRENLSDKYRIKEAENGKEGLTKAQKFVPDLIISDVMMPIMDGVQLCKRIKGDDDFCHIPIILLTARGNVEHQIEGFDIGADEYLSKPFHIEVLQSRIHNILSSRKQLQQKFLSSENAISSKAMATNNKEKLFLDKITQIILDNISDHDFGLPQIQQQLNISRSNLHYKINKLAGTSPSVFVRTVKLKYATELLKKENYSIKEISFISGFKNTSYFTLVFREAYNVTPLQYRNQYL